MYKDENGTPLFVELLRGFAIFFTLAVFIMSTAGILIARYAPHAREISTIFALGSAGFPYSTIYQLAGCSLILAGFNVLLLSDRFFTKMRFLLRYFLFFLAYLFTASIFSIIFKWFPLKNIPAWVGCVLSSNICFLFASGITLLKFKLQDKKYNRLLEKYKARHKE